MTEKELAALVANVRVGHSESDVLEFKRAWWSLANSRAGDEFVKDLSGLANSLGRADEPRRIVVGLASDGTLHNAPLPCDEASLQQRIGASIDPMPSTHFLPIDVEGMRLCVIEFRPPFDPPYVAKLHDGSHRVYIRVGTSVSTASRRQLERMFVRGSDRGDLLRELFADVSKAHNSSYAPVMLASGIRYHGRLHKGEIVQLAEIDAQGFVLEIPPHGARVRVPLGQIRDEPWLMHPRQIGLSLSVTIVAPEHGEPIRLEQD